MKPRVIFVGKEYYRLWTTHEELDSQIFLEGFRPDLYADQAAILEAALSGKQAEAASLGIRTLHGLASEAFLALLFATLQAPHAPAAWLLLYQPRDIGELIAKFQTETFLPSLITPLVAGSWADLAKMLVPIDDLDSPGASAKVLSLGRAWERIASEYTGKASKEEFNSLKHGLRAAPHRPMLAWGGHLFSPESHGSRFPIIEKKGKEVVLGFGARSWAASRLCADIRVMAASAQNLLAITRQFHGLFQDGKLEISLPEDLDLAESEKRTASLTDLRMPTSFRDISRLPPPPGYDEALKVYRTLAGPLTTERTE